MCGITGIVNLKGQETLEGSNIRSMTDAIRHRGPDDEGYLMVCSDGLKQYYGNDSDKYKLQEKDPYIEDIEKSNQKKSFITFGFRRLSIFDLSTAGHQPMCYLNRYWIVYNGEIFNYLELKIELQENGYKFKSRTDTEVVMASYDHWGHKCLNRFNGMWAFVIYDKLENKLFMSRDRFGIKPFYYYKDENHFIFASEIKAIIKHPVVKTAPNIEYCRDYIKSRSKDYLTTTPFENILRLDYASYLEVELDKFSKYNIKEKKYWAIDSHNKKVKFNKKTALKYSEEYYKLLDDSVSKRLRADVEVGSALSGGIDSSSIVYLINKKLEDEGKTIKQKTFSTVWKSTENKYCDESEYIDIISKTLNVKSHQTDPSNENIIEDHKKVLFALEAPPNASLLSWYYTYKMVSETDVKITLDGQGADEQLAGYMSLQTFFTHFRFSRLWAEYKAFSKLPISISKKKNMIQGIFINIMVNASKYILTEKGVIYLIKKLIKKEINPFESINPRLYKRGFEGLMVLLHYQDKISMAHSIESRVPFMDYRLVEYIASIPTEYKIHMGWTKYISRLAFDKKLPAKITWRTDKMGWPSPEHEWFRKQHKELVIKEIESSNLIKKLGIKRNFRKRFNSNEHIWNLLRLYNLSVWYKLFFDNKTDDERLENMIH